MLAIAPEMPLRHELGAFSSLACFKSAIYGIEEALGPQAAHVALISAGRRYGRQIATTLDLNNSSQQEMTVLLRHALGKQGARLCLVDQIESIPKGYRVFCREALCSAGEPIGSNRQVSYTLGVFQGILESVSGHLLQGKQMASVLRGSDHDILEFLVLRQALGTCV